MSLREQILQISTKEYQGYESSKQDSAHIDQLLGYDYAAIEKEVAQKNSLNSEHELWVGLDVQAFQTPYTEIYQILKKFEQHNDKSLKVMDLGAGYGRMGVLISLLCPNWNFLGYEIALERVEAAQRVVCEKLNIILNLRCTDLLQVDLVKEPHDIYFVYDFGIESAIDHTLQQLAQIAKNSPITVVARGGRSRKLIERKHLWLSSLVAPEHFANYSIYRSSVGSY